MNFTPSRDTTVTAMSSLTLSADSAQPSYTGITRREHVQHAANLLWFATALGLTTSADVFAMRSPLPMEHLGLTLIMALLLVPGMLKLASAYALQRITIAVTYVVVWWHYVGLMEPTSTLISLSALIGGCAYAAAIASRQEIVSRVNVASIVGLSLLPLLF